MSDQELPATPSQPGQSSSRPDERGSLPPFLIAACLLTGAIFGLVTVALIWQLERIFH